MIRAMKKLMRPRRWREHMHKCVRCGRWRWPTRIVRVDDAYGHPAFLVPYFCVLAAGVQFPPAS